ncbi:MAG TPA: PDZ domain-containing protein [Labilithrix sp.]|nr:PDZ domain-containing protein [Labilithrix sp.]
MASLLVLAGLAALGAPAQAAPPLPSLPGAEPAKPQSANDVNGFTAEQVRRGVVQIEQGGRPLAVGTVLLKDGRVLTSLSGLGTVEQPEIRYADGTVVKAKIGHTDKAWDLALLIPLTGKWVDGLVPTDADPQGADLRSFLPKAGKLAAAPVSVKGRVDAKSKGGDALKSALELDLKGSPSTPGAPLVDGNGRVVGIVVRACKDGGAPPAAATAPGAPPAPAACSGISIGAPVYALRGFLIKTPATAVQPAPWLGMGGAPNVEGSVKGVKVMGVAPGSPAEKAGLKAGDGADTIVAIDGQPTETPEQLADIISKRSIGQQVKFLVFSGGKFREAMVTLRAAP